MKQNLLACAILLFSTLFVFGQADFVINKSKILKTEYTPVPKDFETKKISWGAVGSFCASDSIHYGAWFRVYPAGNQLKVTVSTGFNWGNISDPLIYVAYLDTVNGFEILEPLGCERFVGAQGDYAIEVFGMHPKKKHFMLIGANAKKEKFALYLTERFQPSIDVEEVPTEVAEEADNSKEIGNVNPVKVEEITPSGKSELLSKVTAMEEGAMIIGRVRKRNGKPISDFDLALLNDGLEETANVTTDEYGVFKMDDIDPSDINLVRIAQDDANILIDMFIYNRDGSIIGKPISLGHNLFSFKANDPESKRLRILTDQDLVVMVKRGKSTMTGKVVDRETFLIGKEGVRVGLYTPRKSLLRSAITDQS
ncbi:MAG: hypothetical protein HQ500_13235 [Flavobacteriales bacterium]|nr:hypothetical protein [Flavobacteriales bacterium]